MLKTQCLPALIVFVFPIGQQYNRDMQIRKAYQFRLKPSADQEKKLFEYVGACRFLWNKVLALNLARLNHKQPLIWYHEADFWSKQWKSSEEYGFLGVVPAHCLQQKLKDLNKAFKDAFDRKQPLKRLPKFKKRGVHDSIRFPEPKQIQLCNRRIKLPKLGWINFFKSQSIIGQMKNVTVSYQSGHWYLSIQVEQVIEVPQHASTSIIGVDMGIHRFAACSNDCVIEPVHAFKTWQNRLGKAQRQLSKKKRFSQNWKKQKHKIRKIHRKICDIRKDFLHKTSTMLSKSHAMIVMEELKILNMSRSAKGTVDRHGLKVKAKSGLNRSILDQGWGEFKRQLAYKLAWRGGSLLTVNPQYTSLTCADCGHVDKKNRLSQSVFVCTACGYRANADHNAAKNILAAGHAVLACGEEALAFSTKQEPLGMGNLVPA